MIFKDDEVRKKSSSDDIIDGVDNVLGSGSDRARCRDIRLTVMGRDVKNWNDYVALKSLDITYINFIAMDINDNEGYQLDAIIKEHDLIINTAGPFQGLRIPVVMEKCLLYSKKYIDVCDDIKLSRICRSQYYQDMAIRYNSTAIISTGIWPGCSSLLADDIIHHSIPGGVEQVDRVRFSFFTAGSGGAGPTILSATFLILGTIS
jgi:saccharopine dehydrogenase-like NADP-dependent oxidoreductase